MTTPLTFPKPEAKGGGLDRRKILTGAAALAASADRESGLCGECNAVRPNRRSDHLNRAAAVGPASRKPLSDRTPRVAKPKLSFGPRFSGLRRHDGG